MSRAITKTKQGAEERSEDTPLDSFAASMKPLFWKVFGFGGLINLLTLSVTLYLWQVYDRVLASQSKDTLFYLTLAVSVAILMSSVLEGVRQMLVSRVGTWMAAAMGSNLLQRSLEQRLVSSSLKLEALRELSAVKNFISNASIFNFLDIGWMPIYLFLVFGLHFYIGVVAVVGGLILAMLAWWNDRATRPVYAANQLLVASNMQKADGLIRNAEVIDAMGMAEDAVEDWSKGYLREIVSTNVAQEKSAKILAITKFVRNMLQIILLCVGALLVLNLEASGGTMVASSILVGRLLAPLESSISQWRNFVLARHSYGRLQQFFKMPMLRPSNVTLPAPKGNISVSGLTYVPPGLPTPVLRNINFELFAGESLAIIGPSASGKTTLARLIIGILMPSTGSVRLDGAESFSWKRKDFGKYSGYLPQDIELFPGTIFSNIARFKKASSEAVIEAAKMAGCHDLVLHLPDGYDMTIGDGAHRLSGGQRQRIGLARALFGRPKLVVLDEPNSNLDSVGENALIETMQRLKKAGTTVIVVAHRSTLLRSVDKILVLQNGRITNFGPASKVLLDLNVLSNTGHEDTPDALPGRQGNGIAKSMAAE
jgi:ATP-binding cassette, subfamily C, bacterial exporter for protease/lipase